MAERLSQRASLAFMVVLIAFRAAFGVDAGSLEVRFKSEEHRQKFSGIDIVRTAPQRVPIGTLAIGQARKYTIEKLLVRRTRVFTH